jgi:hypothetical protein
MTPDPFVAFFGRLSDDFADGCSGLAGWLYRLWANIDRRGN